MKYGMRLTNISLNIKVDDDTTIAGGANDIDSSSSVGLMTRVGRKVGFLLLSKLLFHDYPPPLIPILSNTNPLYSKSLFPFIRIYFRERG